MAIFHTSRYVSLPEGTLTNFFGVKKGTFFDRSSAAPQQLHPSRLPENHSKPAQQQCHAQWACVILLVDYPTFLGPRSKHARQKSQLGLCLQIFTGVFRLHLQCQHQIDTHLLIIQVWGCARVRPASSFWCCLYQVLYPTPTLTIDCHISEVDEGKPTGNPYI